MTRYILLISLILIFISLAKSDPMICPKFQCSKTQSSMPQDVCILFENNIHEINYQNCSASKVCRNPEIGNENTQCTENPIKKEDNSSCANGTDCRSGLCDNTSFICKSLPTGETCASDNQCEVGSFCDETLKVCQKQIEVGNCTRSEMCLNNMGCNAGVCIKYFSLNIGDKTDSGEFCGSGDFDGNEAISGQCIETTFKAPYDMNKPCVAENTCTYTTFPTGEEKTKQCRCSFTDGKAYCPMASSDSYFRKYVTQFKAFYESNAKVHTIYRDNVSYTLRRLQFDTVYYPELKEADICTVKVFASASNIAAKISAIIFAFILMLI